MAAARCQYACSAAPPILGIGEIGLAAVEKGVPGGALGRGDILTDRVGFIKVIGEEPEGGEETIARVAGGKGTLQ